MNVQGAITSREDGESGTRDILFPNQTEDFDEMAIDIGGSLAKVTYFSRPAPGEAKEKQEKGNKDKGKGREGGEHGGELLEEGEEEFEGEREAQGGGSLHFHYFPTDSIEEFIRFLEKIIKDSQGSKVSDLLILSLSPPLFSRLFQLTFWLAKEDQNHQSDWRRCA